MENFSNLVKFSLQSLGKNLSAIILFGSATNEDFLKGISDIDFIFILKEIDFNAIKIIENIEFKFSKFYECRVDIKPFSLNEYESAKKNINSFEFFNGWGLYMISEGRQKTLYKDKWFQLPKSISKERIKQDALDRATFYISKFRKMMFLKRSMILDGEVRVLSDLEFMKICISSCKNILTFCLAYKGIVCYTISETLKESEKYFGNIDSIKRGFENKSNLKFELENLIDIYNICEFAYDTTISFEKSKNNHI